MRSTYTFVTMPVSQSTYDEIVKILLDAKYDHAFHDDGVIDLNGLALAKPQLGAEQINDPLVRLSDVIRVVEAEPELPGSMPWINRWLFLKCAVLGRWAWMKRVGVKGTKKSIVTNLRKELGG